MGISCFASSIGQGEPRWARPACQDIGGVMLLPQGIFINNSFKVMLILILSKYTFT